jgi:hypothetical protein
MKVQVLAYIAIVAICFSGKCFSQSLDQHLAEFDKAARAGDIVRAQDSLLGAAVRLKELSDAAGKPLAPVKQFMSGIDRALNALSGDASELGPLVSSIKANSAKLKSIRPVAPTFGDPFHGISSKDLQSTVPGVRMRALGALRSRGNELRIGYEQGLAEAKAGQSAAREYLRQAEAADSRGYEIEKILSEVNDSPAGPLFNVGGGRLINTLIDVSIAVRPALADRLNESVELVKRYNVVVDQMQSTLARYRNFDEWAGFYSLQDWLRVNAPMKAAEATVETSQRPAAVALDEARQLSQSKGTYGAVPRTDAELQRLTEETFARTSATKAQAAQLLRQAAAQADKADAARQFAGLVGLASSFAGAAEGSSGAGSAAPAAAAAPAQQPPVIYYYRSTTVINGPPAGK